MWLYFACISTYLVFFVHRATRYIVVFFLHFFHSFDPAPVSRGQFLCCVQMEGNSYDRHYFQI